MRIPVNLNMESRLCVIIGGGSVAKRKAYKLLEGGALVRVVSPLLRGPDSDWVHERLELIRRPFKPEDLKGAFLVFAATDDPVVNRDVAFEARSLGILVQCVDSPERSDFTGAI
jgi:siroheme synthase-like protein